MKTRYYPKNDRIKVFFLPYAGGSNYSYFPFTKWTTEAVEVIPLEIPGRGVRHKDPLQTDINLIVCDLLDQLTGKIDGRYAIFGHSMGALIAFLLAEKIFSLRLPMPVHLFLSACQGPSSMKVGNSRYLLPREEFVNRICRISGQEHNILRDERILEFFEPVLRADIQAIDTYQYQASQPLPVPFTVFAGTNDVVSDCEIESWTNNTIFPLNVVKMSGAHFFLFDHVGNIMKVIEKKVQE